MKSAGLYWAGAMVRRFFGAISLSGIKKWKTRSIYALLVMAWVFIIGFITLEYSLGSALMFFGFSVIFIEQMQTGRRKPNVRLLRKVF